MNGFPGDKWHMMSMKMDILKKGDILSGIKKATHINMDGFMKCEISEGNHYISGNL